MKRTDTVSVLFGASWCPFCRMFNPVFESAMKEKGLPGASVDLSDLDHPLWETFAIRVVPTVIVFKTGRPVFRKDGILGRGLSRKDMTEVTLAMG